MPAAAHIAHTAHAAYVTHDAYHVIVNYVTSRCRRFKVRSQDVNDIAHEAWAEILASIATFRPEKGGFEQWARGVARNVIRRYLRNAMQHVERFSEFDPNMDEHPAPDPSPERCAQRAQARCAIVNAAENAKSQQVQAVALHVVDDMSHKDIGRQLKMSEANSQKCFQRGLDHFARCLSSDLLSVMPPFLTSCDEPRTSTPYRWPEWSHYTGQITTAILAALLAALFIPSNSAPQSLPRASVSGEIRTGSIVQEDAMYHYDKHSVVQDEPAVLGDAPVVKPQPASLPSVRDVSTPTRSGDKPTYVQPYAPLPPYKHQPDALDHRLPDR